MKIERRTKIFLALFGSAVLLIALVVIVPRVIRLRRLTREYATVGTIRGVQVYVGEHDGEWPKSCSDIDGPDYCREYSVVRFDITSEDILNDKSLIYDSIKPIHGVFCEYPHAKRHLDELYDIIAEKKGVTNAEK